MVYAVVVAGQVVEKGVVTEIRKVLPKTLYFVVRIQIKRTSSDIIELEPIPKVTRIQEKPRRSGTIATRKLTSNTGTISTKLAQQFLGEEENEDYPWTKYYRPDPELARKYLEEKAAMSTQQRNAGDAPREVASPSAPTLYPRVPMMDE